VSWWNIKIRQFLHGLFPSSHGLAAQHGTGLQWLPHYGFGNSLDIQRYSLLIPPVFSDYSKNLNMFFIPYLPFISMTFFEEIFLYIFLIATVEKFYRI
jgi:hypothetical protein